jgi:hypothetical protein
MGNKSEKEQIMKKMLAGVGIGLSVFAGAMGSGIGKAHANPSDVTGETWVALVVNSDNSQDVTSMFWNYNVDPDIAFGEGMKACGTKWGTDGHCKQETSSRRCIGIALGNGSVHYTAWGDTAAQAYAAAQAKAQNSQARGKGQCADGSKTS